MLPSLLELLTYMEIMTHKNAILFAAAVLTAALELTTPAAAARLRTVGDAVASGLKGRTLYAQKCARCHGNAMTGAEHAPALVGVPFRTEWNGQAARELYKRIISTMPQDNPGTLPSQTVLALTAYLVAQNGGALPGVSKPNDLNALKLDLNGKPAAGPSP